MDMSITAPPFRVAAIYRFCRLDRFEQLQKPLASLCCGQGLRGTLLLAPEGINGTVAGTEDAVACLMQHLESVPEFSGLEVKYSEAASMPFRRMKVRLKREIVTMGVDRIDPLSDAGAYVEPADWNALIADPDTVVIDTRNDYEVGLGTFERATNPKTRHFREFPKWLDERKEALAGKRVAMFCTGGIRCEKATAYARSIGIDRVFHLKGGILSYLEQVPPQQSLWKGECFVFDERVSVGHGLVEGDAAMCRACGRPLTEADRASEHYRAGISCAACIGEFSDEDRARFAERQRQLAGAG